MTAWLDFSGFDISEGENLFNAVVSGGSFLPPGEHNVTIAALECDSVSKQLKITYEGADEKTTRDRVYLKDYLDPRSLSIQFRSVLKAILGTNVKCKEYLEALQSKPQLIQALTGLKLKIKIEESKKGYTVETVAGVSKLIDAGAEKATDALEKADPPEFTSFSELKEWVKSYNDNCDPADRLWRAYPVVTQYNRHDDGADSNVQHIQTAIDATAKTGGMSGNLNAAILG